MIYVLLNTVTGAHCEEKQVAEKLKEVFPGEEIEFTNVMDADNKQEYIDKLSECDKLVVVGGDGTLNRFVNGIEDREYPFPIYCYAAGTGNDFINDVSGVKYDGVVLINQYIRDLPTITVKGRTYKFINGIGYGIDGYCCEEGDKYRERTGKAPNYTAIAIKGTLYDFKAVNARITVDGVTREYNNVWMAPAMNGRYFGGGMMVTPAQDRLNPERELSFAVAHCKSRIKILTVFPKIFKGKHVKHTDIFTVIKGKEVTVEFDRPTALQIDGETVLAVTSYTARSSVLSKKHQPV